MSQLVVTKTYEDGQVLGEANLDAAFQSIEQFINSTKLTGENIQDNSITAAEIQTNSIPSTAIAASAITTAKIQDSAITLAKLSADVQLLLTPTGSISAYSGDSAPSGWLLCDGTAVSRTTYSALFAIVGERFGSGDGTTTFNTPDFRGRFLRGRDAGAGRDPDAADRTAMNAGGATGDAVGSVQSDDMGIGNLTVSVSNGESGSTPGLFPTSAASASTFNPFTSTQSGASGLETRPENAYVNFIIKT